MAHVAFPPPRNMTKCTQCSGGPTIMGGCRCPRYHIGGARGGWGTRHLMSHRGERCLACLPSAAPKLSLVRCGGVTEWCEGCGGCGAGERGSVPPPLPQGGSLAGSAKAQSTLKGVLQFQIIEGDDLIMHWCYSVRICIIHLVLLSYQPYLQVGVSRAEKFEKL